MIMSMHSLEPGARIGRAGCVSLFDERSQIGRLIRPFAFERQQIRVPNVRERDTNEELATPCPPERTDRIQIAFGEIHQSRRARFPYIQPDAAQIALYPSPHRTLPIKIMFSGKAPAPFGGMPASQTGVFLKNMS